MIFDLFESKIKITDIYCTKEVASVIPKNNTDIVIEIVSKEDLSRISFLKTTPEIVALCRIPENLPNWDAIKRDLTIVLDDIQDPGNLGTIVRLADWFGIKNIICSEGCADLYNPKVIQSTMGAFARVNVNYLSLQQFLGEAKQYELPVYGTFLEGENLYTTDLTSKGLIVMGNEGNGISDSLDGLISRKINIPSYPGGEITSESLNVAIATAVICSEFRRRIICKG